MKKQEQTALEVQENPRAIINPEEDVVVGQTVAKQLISLVKDNNWSVNIQGNDYLQVEAWQTVGKFYGLSAKATESKFVEYGSAKGFEAKAEILNKDGVVVGGATALCLDDERNWKGKPLFQLKSMAQTRAVSKAYRLILSWVVVLAGYKPTPAEEMQDVEPEREKIAEPAWMDERQPGEDKRVPLRTEKQRKAIKMLQNQGKIDPTIKTTGMSMTDASQLLSSVWGKK